MIKKLILTYQFHRHLGALLLPAIAIKEENLTFYQLTPIISEANNEEIPDYNNDIKSLIGKCMEYGEKGVYQFFGRHSANQTEFYQNLDADFCKKNIRPYIEKRIFEVIKLAQNQDISIYFKNSNNVFETDLLSLLPTPANCAYHFDYLNNTLQYQLTLFCEQKKLKLRNQKVYILCESPALFIVNNTICFVENFNAKQVIPFVKKEFISVPEKMVDQYFNSFVKKTLELHKVSASGFTIETPKPKLKAKLSLEQGFNSQFALNLEFTYDKYSFRSDNLKKKSLVFFDAKSKSFLKIERDAAKEQEIVAFLRTINLVNKTGTLYGIKGSSNNTEIIAWINQHVHELENNNIEIHNTLETKYFLKDVVLEMQTSESIDWFDVRAIVKFGELSLPFVKLRNHIIKGNKEYKLPDNSIAILPDEWFAKYQSLMGMGIIKGNTIKIHKYQYNILRDIDSGVSNSMLLRFENLIHNDNNYHIPKDVIAELRNYQKDGYNWMRKLREFRFGGCLADDMGLGKTLQTITILAHHHLHGTQKNVQTPDTTSETGQLSLFDEAATYNHNGTSLIIAPSSLVHNWKNEIKKFAPQISITAHIGNNRKLSIDYFHKYDIIISTLGVVRNDIRTLKDFRFEYIVIDESQTIKNPNSQTYKAVIQLQADNKLVLTGTPVENSLQDLWAQLNFVNPGILGNLRWFKNKYVTPIEKLQDEDALHRLKQLTAPFILRRKKSEVAKDLPSLTEQTIMCEMTEQQAKRYEEQKSIARNALLNVFSGQTIGTNTTIVLKSLNTLRQMANSPSLIDEAYTEESGKTEIVTRHLENLVAEQHKVLLFSSYIKHLELFEKICLDNKWGYTKLTGSVPQNEREKLIAKFQTDKQISIFLISLKAGGVGLNLTAADYVMILDPWWNPAAEAQAINRAHRIGQSKNVMVYRYITKDTIEEKILTLQKRKQKISNDLIDDKVALKNLNMNEIKSFFD